MAGASFAALPAVPSGQLDLKVDKTTTVNTKPLSGNVALTLDDVPATATKATVLPATKELAELGAKATIPLTTIASPAGTDTLIGVPTMGTKTVAEMGGLAAVAAYVAANSTCDCTLVGTALVITAKAYGPALNGTVISGTLLAAPGTMANGLPPQVSTTTALATAKNPGTISAAQAVVLAATSGANSGDETKTRIATATGISEAQMTELGTGKLTGLASGGWADNQANLAKAMVPALTGFRAFKIPEYPLGITTMLAGMADASLMGGAVNFTAGSWTDLTGIIVTNPSIQSWAFGFRGIFTAATGFAGLKYGNHRVAVSRIWAVDHTNYVLHTYAGSSVDLISTKAVDGSWHDFCVYFNGTTLTMTVDGVVVAAQTNITQVPAGTAAFSVFSDANTITLAEVFYAYVAP